MEDKILVVTTTHLRVLFEILAFTSGFTRVDVNFVATGTYLIRFSIKVKMLHGRRCETVTDEIARSKTSRY